MSAINTLFHPQYAFFVGIIHFLWYSNGPTLSLSLFFSLCLSPPRSVYLLASKANNLKEHNAVANARGDVINLFTRIFNLVLQTFISMLVLSFFNLSIVFYLWLFRTELVRLVQFIIYVSASVYFLLLFLSSMQSICTSYIVHS